MEKTVATTEKAISRQSDKCDCCKELLPYDAILGDFYSIQPNFDDWSISFQKKFPLKFLTLLHYAYLCTDKFIHIMKNKVICKEPGQ